MIVSIIGTGYVGLVTGACLASRGHRVRCVDISRERVDAIRAGRVPFYEPGLEALLEDGLASGRLSATSDLAAAISGSEVSIIAVGTPAKGDKPDLSYVQAAAAQIGAALRSHRGYHVVAVKSTVAPGTTSSLVKNTIEAESGLSAGRFGLCMNPEFLREGCAVEDFMNPDRIVIGQWDSRAGDCAEALYDSFECPKLRMSLEEAELTKYASNSLLSTLISYSNELAALCEATPGADIDTVFQGLHLDRRLNPIQGSGRVNPEILAYLRAGIGFGGSCLPKDVNALRVYGQSKGIPVPVLDAVMSTNLRRPEQIVNLAERALDGLPGKTIALLGLAFKAGTDDLRTSPALSILSLLKSRGARVRGYDRMISAQAASTLHLDHYTGDLEGALDSADAAVLTLADPTLAQLDWGRLAARMRSPVLIDGRNALRGVPLPEAVRYYPIGRGGLFPEPASAANPA